LKESGKTNILLIQVSAPVSQTSKKHITISSMSEPKRKPGGMKLFLCIAFLNAFTDIGHKIVLHNAIYKHYDGSTQMALAAIINALILLPFVMTFSPAGFLSDKYSKKKIIQTSALLSIPITLLITLTYGFGLFQLAFAATFLLALQSAIYGPAKYGYIQELVGSRKLPAGIGAVQAVTIVALLSSSVLYSAGFENWK